LKAPNIVIPPLLTIWESAKAKNVPPRSAPRGPNFPMPPGVFKRGFTTQKGGKNPKKKAPRKRGKKIKTEQFPQPR